MGDGGSPRFSWLPSLTGLLVPQIETIARCLGFGSSGAKRPSWCRSFSRSPWSLLSAVCGVVGSYYGDLTHHIIEIAADETK